MIPIKTFPNPTEAQTRQTAQCLQYLVNTYGLLEGAGLCFLEYMRCVLYGPNVGYYTANNPIFGKEGDFITAPLSGHFFAHSLANTFEPLLNHLGAPNLIEIGAGTGVLAQDLMAALVQKTTSPLQYGLIELSSTLATVQQNLLKKTPYSHQYQWLTEIPRKFTGIIFANELLDAMPFERLRWDGKQWLQSMVYYVKEKGLYEDFVPLTDLTVLSLFTQTKVFEQSDSLAPGFTTEFCPSHADLLRDISTHLEKGFVFFIDYGGNAKERYHPGRHTGSLRCYYQHLIHEDFFSYPGIQDLTADVDFSFIAEHSIDLGFQVQGYCTQAAFLLANGILEYTEYSREEQQALQNLLQPFEMGERMKILVLSKNIEEIDLPCFKLQNWNYRL